jgi:hypothetical protein
MEPKHYIDFDALDDIGLRDYADGVIADLVLGYTPHEVARRRNLALAIDGDRVAVVLPGWVARIGYDTAYYHTPRSLEAARLHAAGGHTPRRSLSGKWPLVLTPTMTSSTHLRWAIIP